MVGKKNTDICIVMDIDEEKGLLTLYSPIEKKNITVEVEVDILESIYSEDAVAFEVDLDSKKII